MMTKLKLSRMVKGLTQSEAAKEMKISRSMYSLLENGRLIPTSNIKQLMFDVFGDHSEELLFNAVNEEEVNV